MKILYVIDNIEFGGGERVFLQLASGFKESYSVFVAATPGGEFEQSNLKLGVKFIPVNMKRRISLNTIIRLNRIICKNNIDIVHSQGARADFFSRVASRLARVPVNICTVAMPVEGFDVGTFKKIIYQAFDRFASRYVDKFIVVSESLRNTLIEKRGICKNRIVRIYNGIELTQYHLEVQGGSIREECSVYEGVPLIGTVGRMVWQKGFEFLVKAIPAVVRTIPSAKFLFVGDGPLRGKLESLSEALGVKDNVIFSGFRSDINSILSVIDLLVVPSLLEGFPMVTLEAMAMGKPIIATNIEGIVEQIDDQKNGIIVPAEDHMALTEAILRLIRDKSFANKLGLSARKKVEQAFSVEKMVAETEKVYLSVIGTN